MASGRHGVKVFDPSFDAQAGETGVDSGGGGGINSGSGPFYSKTTIIAENGWSDVTDIVVARGDLVGVLTAEVSNADDQQVRLGQDVWAPEPAITIAAV